MEAEVLRESEPVNLHDRVSKIEGMLTEMNDGIKIAILAQTKALEKHGQSFEKLAEQIASALGFQGKMLEMQSQSLSLPLLKDVLLPVTFKVFAFFAGLVVALIGAILGIKWVFADLLR